MRKSHKATDFQEHRVPIIYVSIVRLASDAIHFKPLGLHLDSKIVLCKLKAVEQIGLGSKIARALVIT